MIKTKMRKITLKMQKATISRSTAIKFLRDEMSKSEKSTHYSFLLQMLGEFLLNDISVSYEDLDYGLGEAFHVPLPDLRVRTFQFGHHVEALG